MTLIEQLLKFEERHNYAEQFFEWFFFRFAEENIYYFDEWLTTSFTLFLLIKYKPVVYKMFYYCVCWMSHSLYITYTFQCLSYSQMYIEYHALVWILSFRSKIHEREWLIIEPIIYRAKLIKSSFFAYAIVIKPFIRLTYF